MVDRKTKGINSRIQKIKDTYLLGHYIYECDSCMQCFPIWYTSNEAWNEFLEINGKQEFKPMFICKSCFGEVIKNPVYWSLNQYLEFRKQISPKVFELIRPIIEEIWDWPEEHKLP